MAHSSSTDLDFHVIFCFHMWTGSCRPSFQPKGVIAHIVPSVLKLQEG